MSDLSARLSVVVETLLGAGIRLAEAGRVPDGAIRAAMRRVIASRAKTVDRADPAVTQRLIRALGRGPVTEVPHLANRQHYEVPAGFFELMLGPRLKYSSCLWDSPATTLPQAEEAMLELTARRAGLQNGQRVLELGCGWGSLTLWMAERYPASRITAVTNSNTQARFVADRASAGGHRGVKIEVTDVARFATADRYDRVVTVEMLEHVRNYREIFRRMAGWLERDGRAFVHVFAHRSTAYLYEDRGPADWMARTFFSGGVMPSHGLFSAFSEHLRIEESWRFTGLHYQMTLEAWLERLDRSRAAAEDLLGAAGEPQPARAVQRWRMFLMACAELFAFQAGKTWGVSHYALEPA